jgi:hypothetical protein
MIDPLEIFLSVLAAFYQSDKILKQVAAVSDPDEDCTAVTMEIRINCLFN